MELIGGRFRIDGIAGEGGFGSVYRGYDERMKRPVAIKVVNRIAVSEAEIMRDLQHGNLPRLYDILQDREHTIIVMEWIEGVTLEKHLEDYGALSEERSVQIGEEILEVLEYLHSRKPAIIYQDLKPSNIMVKPDGNICLIDLGTALIRDYKGDLSGIGGTMGYVAPEQRGICGIQHVDERSDIYAWGAVMYSMLSGRILSKPPYTMEKIRYVCPQISFGLARIISKCTKRNENDRYKSVSEIINALHGSGYVDLLYRGGFAVIFALCICPFVIVWILGAGTGLYGRLSDTLRDCLAMGIKNMNWSAVRRLEEPDLKITGGLMLAFSWMILGFRRLQIHKFMKINRSVYLSERKFPGLWISAIFAGIILGYGLGGNVAGAVSNASEILPVSVIGEGGERNIVRYGSTYTSEGDLQLLIDKETLGKYGAEAVTVTLEGKEYKPEASRTILLNFF